VSNINSCVTSFVIWLSWKGRTTARFKSHWNLLYVGVLVGYSIEVKELFFVSLYQTSNMESGRCLRKFKFLSLLPYLW